MQDDELNRLHQQLLDEAKSGGAPGPNAEARPAARARPGGGDPGGRRGRALPHGRRSRGHRAATLRAVHPAVDGPRASPQGVKQLAEQLTTSTARSRDVLKRTSMRFAAALLMALASVMVGPNAAAAQHHNQVPGFYGLKVGDLEVTALFDGPGVFDQHWLKGTRAKMDEVVNALHEDSHMLDGSETAFLVNTGKQLILIDAGSGTWFGAGAFGRLVRSLRSAGYTPEEVDLVLVTHLHADHVGGLTTQDGKRVFPNAEVYVAKAERDFWLSPEIAAKAPKDAQPFFQS